MVAVTVPDRVSLSTDAQQVRQPLLLAAFASMELSTARRRAFAGT
jgi:hypothetical protein